MLTYLPGRPIAGIRPVTPELLGEIGEALARLDLALTGFTHPAARRDLKWDLVRAGWIRERLDAIREPRRRALVEKILARNDAEVTPALPRLRRSVVYADANEHNVLVAVEPGRRPRLAGLLDFGDMVETVTVSEIAVAAAYAAFGVDDPLDAVCPLVAAYHRFLPLTKDEISLVDILIRTRLAVSVVNSACRADAEPEDPYLTVSEAPAWSALQAFEKIRPGSPTMPTVTPAGCRRRRMARPSHAGSRSPRSPSPKCWDTICAPIPSPSWISPWAAGCSAPTRRISKRLASRRRSRRR